MLFAVLNEALLVSEIIEAGYNLINFKKTRSIARYHRKYYLEVTRTFLSVTFAFLNGIDIYFSRHSQKSI